MKIVVSPRIENSEFMTHLGELPIAKYLIKKQNTDFKSIYTGRTFTA